MIPIEQRQTAVQIRATYHVVGNYTPSTKYVWLVCHGYGQLARYFVRRFDVLNPDEHYIVAPEGLSRFYLDSDYGKVGASWLTKENRTLHLENQLAYLQQVYRQEIDQRIDLTKVQLILFGFSQGVATVTRWAAHQQIPFSKLILWAGSFPGEFEEGTFHFVPSTAQIFMVIGTQDPYANYFRIEQQTKRVEAMLLPPKVITFEGGHEVRRDVLQKLVSSF